MSALNPWFLASALAVAVPVFLHLYQRQQTQRVSFPALRYLERTEREHARRIKMRQLLLLLLRVSILILLALAGARLFLRGRGSAHPATAVVIILDNSLSSGLVLGETRRLDELKELAYQTLDAAGDEDVFWVLRAGEPWLVAIPGDASRARAIIDGVRPTATRGDLSAALHRAAELLAANELAGREIHLLSDLQASAFDPADASPAGKTPVVVWMPAEGAPANHALTRIVVGGGLPPLEGQASQVTVASSEPAGNSAPLPVRLTLGGKIRGAATIPPGSEATIPLPISGAGWIEGTLDTDPDALRADDRRYFAFRSRPAPAVWTAGDPGLFVSQAIAVLTDAGRIRTSDSGGADLLVAIGGEGLELRGSGTSAVVFPHPDGSLLPAFNRRLGAAGVSWRLQGRASAGEAPIQGDRLPEVLQAVRARAWFTLVPSGQPSSPSSVLAEAAGAPWAVETRDGEGRRILLIASALDGASTTLPVSTAMLRFMDWAAGEWAGGGGSQPEYIAGEPVPAPSRATRVRTPSGEEIGIDGSRTVTATGTAGFYRFLEEDAVVGVAAVNPPAEESLLEPVPRASLRDAVGPTLTLVGAAGSWAGSIYRERQGPELWWFLSALALFLLVAEALLAAAGRSESRPVRRHANAQPSADASV